MSSLPSPDAVLSCSWRFCPNQHHVASCGSPPSGDQERCQEGCWPTPRCVLPPGLSSLYFLHFPDWPCQGAITSGSLESRWLCHCWVCLRNLLWPTVLICCYLRLLKSPKVLQILESSSSDDNFPFLLLYNALQWALEVLVRESLESKGRAGSI